MGVACCMVSPEDLDLETQHISYLPIRATEKPVPVIIQIAFENVNLPN